MIRFVKATGEALMSLRKLLHLGKVILLNIMSEYPDALLTELLPSVNVWVRFTLLWWTTWLKGNIDAMLLKLKNIEKEAVSTE